MAEESEASGRTPLSSIPLQTSPQVPVPPNVGIGIAFQTGPIPPQVLDKITPEHIGQILATQENQSKRQYDLSIRQIEYRERDRDKQRQNSLKSERNFMLFGLGVLVFVIIISLICFYFNQGDIVKSLVFAILGFGGGFVAGRGYERLSD
jgi:hypothetical protein